MAHFAKIGTGNIVVNVEKVNNDVAPDEATGIAFLKQLYNEPNGTWVQTSYNTIGGIHYTENTLTPSADQSKALRKNYASVGYFYDQARDAFIEPKRFDSWTLDEDTCQWLPPIPKPAVYTNDNNEIMDTYWNENEQKWIEFISTSQGKSV